MIGVSVIFGLFLVSAGIAWWRVEYLSIRDLEKQKNEYNKYRDIINATFEGWVKENKRNGFKKFTDHQLDRVYEAEYHFTEFDTCYQDIEKIVELTNKLKSEFKEELKQKLREERLKELLK